MAKKRREPTDDVKRDAVRFVTEQGYGVTEACRSLNISTSMFRRWRLPFDSHPSIGTSKSGLSSAEREAFES